MKTTARILSIMIVLALLAGCAPAPTFAPTATSTLLPISINTPMPAFTNTPEPEPTPTVKIEIPLEMQSVTIEAAKEFANAMTNAGMPTTAEQILGQGLVIEQQERNGDKFEVASTEDGWPLMIREKEAGHNEWRWRAANLGDVPIPIGTSVSGSELNGVYPITAEDWGPVSTNGEVNPVVVDNPAWGYDGANQFVRSVPKNHELFIGAGYYPRFLSQQLENTNESTAQSYIEQRNGKLLGLVESAIYQGKKPNLTLFNEMIWTHNGNSGWYEGKDNSLYEVWGTKWPAVVYVDLYKQAVDRGIQIGGDGVRIGWSNSHLTTSVQRAQQEIQAIQQFKNDVAELSKGTKYAINSNDVQIDVQM